MASKFLPRHIIRTARSQIPITVQNALLHNGSSEPLSSRHRAIFKWYSCGPTVYDDAHLGHARAYVSLDIIRRIVSSLSGVHVDYVLGVTDIDDKIVRRAAEKKTSPLSLARHYEERFFQDMNALNILPPTKILRVTEHIPELQQFISELIDLNAAYVSEEGNVYFSVKCSGDRYGQLDPSRSLSELESKHSNASTAHPDKLDQRDFALWKRMEPNEQLHDGIWDSPWGKGRPGWHVECSAMSMNALGSHLDLHTGGIDLRFPHHTNELATAEAKLCMHKIPAPDNVERWSHTWLHAGHLHLHGRKMSKSVKNFVTIRDFLAGGGSADAFRTFCLQRRYSSPVEYSEDQLFEAQSFLSRVRSFLSKQSWQATFLTSDPAETMVMSMHPGCEQAKTLYEEISVAEDEIEEALADNFNTPKAMSRVAQLVKAANSVISTDGEWKTGAAALAYNSACRVVSSTLGNLGISGQILNGSDGQTNDNSDIIEAYVKFRSAVRDAGRQKDLASIFALCDNARDNAASKFGIRIADKKDGSSSWTRT